MANTINLPLVIITQDPAGVIDVSPPPSAQPIVAIAPVNISDTFGNPISATGGFLNVLSGITPTKFLTAQATAAGLNAAWTPAAGKKFRLLAFSIEIPADGSQAVAGDLIIKLKDAAVDIGLSWAVFVPAVAVTTVIGVGWQTGWIFLGRTGILSAAANNALNINLSAALATSQVRIIMAGTEE